MHMTLPRLQLATPSPSPTTTTTTITRNDVIDDMWGSRVGAVVRALVSHQCVPSVFHSRTRRHMWVEFVVDSLLCSERFFSGFSGFPLSSKTNISKFHFDLDVRHFSHESLARVIAQALPVLDVKFTFFMPSS